MPRKSWKAILVVAGAMLPWAGTVATAEAADTPGVTKDKIVIGTTNPLTGTVASACKPVSDGALAWFDQVNAAGGINGRKIENIVLDDRYTAQEALANVRELSNRPVFAFFGGCGTIQVPAILQVVKSKNIPYLFPYAGFEPLTQEKNAFLLLPLYAPQLKALVPHALKQHGPGTVFSVVQQVPGADQTAAAIEAAVKAAGGKMVGLEFTTAGQSDQTPLALKIKQASPDYVVMAEAAPDAARIFKAMDSQSAFPKKFVLGTSTLATGAFINPVGKIADGRLLTASPTAPADGAEAASCNKALQAKGITPDGFSLFGCATAQIFVEAVKEMGNDVTRNALAATLRGWKDKKVSPVLPPLTFTADSNVGERSMILVGVKDGKLVTEGLVENVGSTK